jgi:flagellin
MEGCGSQNMSVSGLSSGDLLLQQTKTQQDLSSTTKSLSSGLRINSAADDPSGLAISSTLQTKVNNLDQGISSIQDASNALEVADGALSTITTILQRQRTLVVEAQNGVSSSQDLSDIQTELNALTQEVNTISQNTTFNGINLLNGSLSSNSVLGGQLLIPVNQPTDNGASAVLDTTTDPNEPNLGPTPGLSGQFEQLIQVTSFDSTTNLVTANIEIESPDPTFGPTQTATIEVVNGTDEIVSATNTGGEGAATGQTFTFTPPDVPDPATNTPQLQQASQEGLGQEVLSFNVGVLTANDVGQENIIVSTLPQEKPPGQNAQVNTGDGEGTVISIDIPAVNTVNLGISDLVLGDNLQNQANEFLLDNGLTQLGNIRAQIGAQIDSLQEASQNASIAAVNTQAAESNIRDANIAQETTEFTKDQILNQIQTNVLSNINNSAAQILTLVATE